MNVIIEQSVLYLLLQKSIQAISNNPLFPLTSCILFEVDQNKLTLIATDLEIFSRISINVEQSEPGRVVLPAKQLFSFVKYIADGTPIKLAKIPSSNSCLIQYNQSEIQLQGYDPVEFPQFPAYTLENPVSLNNAKSILRKISSAMTVRDNNSVFNSMYFEIVNHAITVIVGTDTHRLASYGNFNILEDHDTSKYLIPHKFIQLLLKEAQEEKTISLYFASNLIIYKNQNHILISRLSEGEFPDFRPVIPRKTKTTITITRSEILNALERVSALTQYELKEFNVIMINIENNKISLACQIPEKGRINESLFISQIGENQEFKLNVNYVIEAVKAFSDSDELIFEIWENNKPIIFKAENQPDFIYLVLPIRMV